MDLTTAPEQTPDGILTQAIQESELLLSYAAEQGKDVASTDIMTIVHSKHALASDAWDETKEAAFWDAYSNLCLATAPVSRESLEATRLRPQKILFGLTRNVSQASRSVRYYQAITIVAMLILLTFQIYWVFVSTVVEGVNRTNSEMLEKSVALYALERKQSAEEARDLIAADPETKEQKLTLATERERLYMELSQLELSHKANQQLLNTVNLIGPLFNKRANEKTPYFETDKRESQRQQENLLLQTGSISLDIMSLYLLPILYGLVGACAYILRTISQQIKERTFTNASKIRLQLRMFLGALAGFSIAWFTKPVGGVGFLDSLTPLALAFLAGYSVELLFSAMDTLIAAFSRDRPAA